MVARFSEQKNIPRKGPLNRRSLGFARDDKGEGQASTKSSGPRLGMTKGRDLRFSNHRQAGQSRKGRLNTRAEFSAVPSGLLDDAFLNPGLTSWATFRRPYGTNCKVLTQDS